VNRKLGIFLMVLMAAALGCQAGAEEQADAQTAGIQADGNQGAAASAKPVSKVTKPAVDTSSYKDAPAWNMPDLAGKALKSTDLEGKVVLVDFWATWCGPCKMAIPHLMELYAEYASEGLEVVGVSLDRQGASVVKPFVDKTKINYPVVIGNAKVANDFGGVQGIPTAFIISQDGKIYRKYVGFKPRQIYENDIRTLLGLGSAKSEAGE